MTNESEIFGYVYRIFHPKQLAVGKDGQTIQPCYVGKTEETIYKRFLGHKRAAKKFAGPNRGGDCKLHATMWANKPESFKIEQLAVAYSPEDLSLKESKFVKKYDSINNGWNKITASTTKTSRGQKVGIVLDGKILNFESKAHLCRQLEISASSLAYWRKKLMSLSDAVTKAVKGKEGYRFKQSQVTEVFKRTYGTINAVARDKRINRFNLSSSIIRRRIKKEGMSPEEALSKPRERGIDLLTVRLPSKQTMTFKTITEAHKKLSDLKLTDTKYQTVVAYLNRGYTPEQAFGFEKRPWELKYEPLDRLVAIEGYEYVGKKNPYANPVVVDFEKKIYPSIKDFSKTYGLDYTTVADKLKNGDSIEKILKKSGHI